MIRLKSVCISHGEDVDGLVCAIYLQHLKGALPILVTYDGLKDALRKIEPSVDELYICDLGVREELYEDVIHVSSFASVTIVDHHPTSEKVLEKLRRSGVTVVYSDLDCASVLLYDHFRDELSRKAARLAVYAAISDQFDKGPIASRLLSEFDKHLMQYEALMLTHALDRQNNDEFKALIFKELKHFKFPHKMKRVPDIALAHLDYLVKLIETLPKKAERLKRIAYVEGTDKSSKGTVASLLIDSMGVDVGLCYKKKGEETVVVSLRGKSGLTLHLGEVTKKLAERYGGFGGGHNKASGAKIPQNNLMKFINDLNSELETHRTG